jgi:signal transduction histidine kinase
MTWINANMAPVSRIRHGEVEASRALNLLQEERRKERVQIARELHDSFLQGVVSASMQLCLAEDWVPAESPAKPILRRALDLLRKTIEEGRAALLGLRIPLLLEGSLEKEFSDFLNDIAPSERAGLRMVILGENKPLEATAQEQIFLIVREALLNALRHSGATKVEVEIEYLPRKLRVVVRDAGRGIDPHELQWGTRAHWGLTGMSERAASIGAKLRIWSKRGHGTEVEIALPLREQKGSRLWA